MPTFGHKDVLGHRASHARVVAHMYLDKALALNARYPSSTCGRAPFSDGRGVGVKRALCAPSRMRAFPADGLSLQAHSRTRSIPVRSTMTLSPPGPPPVEPARRASPRLRWASLPTRARLVVLVLAIDLLAAVVSFSLIVVNARSAVQVEMQATLANIELVVADTIGLAQSASPREPAAHAGIKGAGPPPCPRRGVRCRGR